MCVWMLECEYQCVYVFEYEKDRIKKRLRTKKVERRE